MMLCDRCDRLVTADTVCSISDCPHKDITLRATAGSGSEDVATVTFEDNDAPVSYTNIATDSVSCEACGAENDASARFCAACGATINGGAADVIDQRIEPPRPAPEFRNIALGAAALLIIGLLAFLAFGQKDSGTSPVADKPAVAIEAKPAKPVGQETEMWTVTDAIVREKPTAKNSKELSKLPRGTKLYGILQMGSDGESKWLWLADGSGYVGAIILSQNEPPKLVKILGNQTWYAPDAVAIYALPDSASPQIATIPQGQKIRLVGITENGFAEAELQKGVGYIAAGGYDFSVSKPPLSNADQEAFYAMLGMANSSSLADYTGSTAEQGVQMTVWSPYSRDPQARIIYRNSANNTTCWSTLKLLGRDEKGKFKLLEAPDTSGTPCGKGGDILMSSGVGYINIWWTKDSKPEMSAKLYYAGKM